MRFGSNESSNGLEQAALAVEALSHTSRVSGLSSPQTVSSTQAAHTAPALSPFTQNGAPGLHSAAVLQAMQSEPVAPPPIHTGVPPLQSELVLQAYAVCPQDELAAPALEQLSAVSALLSLQLVSEPQAMQSELVAPPLIHTGVLPLQSALVLQAYAVCAHDELEVPPYAQLSAVSALLSLQSATVSQA
jgi:hypothetical protein